MLEKNEEYEVTIENFGANGEGVARINNFAVFIPFALPGELVKIKIVKVKRNFAYGKLLEVIKPSKIRRSAECPVFHKCGGCNMQHISYSEQLKIKSAAVRDCLAKTADINIHVPLTESCENEYRYRNKFQLPVRNTPKGNVVGLFREGTHEVVPIDDCLIQKKWASCLIQAVKNYIDTGISCFNEEKKEGYLKHVVAREVCGKMLIVLVVTERKLKNIDCFIDLLKTWFSDFSVFVNYNAGNGNVIFGSDFKLVYGEERTVAEVNGIKMPIGPESFMQVNDEVRDKIYARVSELVGGDSKTAVIDAYSGAGFLTAVLAGKVGRAYGVECVAEAVACANELARANGLSDKITNICGKCEEVLPDLVRRISGEYSSVSVVLDPPRKGCDVAVLNSLIEAKPQKIVYVSCNPATLARDLGILTGTLYYCGNELKKTFTHNGLYKIEFIRPYDMFPNTKHVETVVLMSRR
ncbi:MAG: 23S rRNA (uracil(1939)-C(5))-methyltransferase RlmD [Clostridia bacterium]|nr:23S rRNA (uracil(1939)-C(5))-methyltransferase RlmD [Clostridia bacterium]